MRKMGHLPLAGRAAAVLGLCLLVSCAAGPGVRKSDEKDPRAQYNLGSIYLNNFAADEASLNKAISHFQKALSLDPKYYLAYNALGVAHFMRRDMPAAASALEKCLEINPAFTEARYNLGNIFLARGFLDKAEEEFKRAVKDETYASRQLPLFSLAKLAFQRDKNHEALDYVDRALRYDPRMFLSHLLRGEIQESLEDFEEALVSYENAVRLMPEDMSLRLKLGLMCLKTERLDRAREALTMVLEKTDDPELRKKASEALGALKLSQ